MSAGHPRARPLTGREQHVLAAVEHSLDRDVALRAALAHAQTPTRSPRHAVLALSLGTGCAAVTVTALLVGPAPALILALVGIAALSGVIVSFSTGRASRRR